MAADKTVAELLAAADDKTRRNFELLRERYPDMRNEYVLFSMAAAIGPRESIKSQDTHKVEHLDYLIGRFGAPAEMRSDRFVLSSYYGRFLVQRYNVGSTVPSGDFGKWLSFVTECHLGISHTTFLGIAPDYGRQPDDVEYSHVGVEKMVGGQTQLVQKHFFALKDKYPNCQSDWVILLLALHVPENEYIRARYDKIVSETAAAIIKSKVSGGDSDLIGANLHQILIGNSGDDSACNAIACRQLAFDLGISELEIFRGRRNEERDNPSILTVRNTKRIEPVAFRASSGGGKQSL